MALNSDNTRKQLYSQSFAIRETGIANSTLMDPKLKVGVGGLPVDSFKFDQDPMTNISISLMQQFERSGMLDLRQQQANQNADAMVLQVTARELEVINNITQRWLELGYQQIAERIFKQNRQLMKEMELFIQTNYSIGKGETQDLLNAQLQVTKLDEKLQANAQMQQRLKAQLSEWLGADWLTSTSSFIATNQLDWQKLQQQLAQSHDQTTYYQQLNRHPMVKMADMMILANRTQVEMAKKSYIPQFGVEVMYANRQANNMKGEPASDLVSAYLTMDIPLFTKDRQDKNLSAAQYQVGAMVSQKDTLLIQMNAKVNALLVDKHNLEQRLERYQSTLIPQAIARIRATERGYRSDTTQFNDVIIATNDKLTLQLEQQRLLTDLNIANSNLSALLGGFDYQITTPTLANAKADNVLEIE